MKGNQGWLGMTEEYKGWLKIFRGNSRMSKDGLEVTWSAK
jgi:hypothetical protein